MVYYVKMGRVPEQRHTYDDKNHIQKEELFGLNAFDGRYSLLYHKFDPAEIESSSVEYEEKLTPVNLMEHRHLRTGELGKLDNFYTGRQVLFFNDSTSTGIIDTDANTDEYFRDALCDEVFFVHSGSGAIQSPFGILKFRAGDFIYIPKGTTYRTTMDERSFFFFTISTEHMEIPENYINKYGQLKEGMPYYSRDIQIPEFIEPENKTGNYRVKVDYGQYYINTVRNFPVFDLEGYDGYLYPFSINIDKFAPIVGKLHMPPPVHTVFESKDFMIGAFLPRLFDFHERAIPIPYYHNNIDSDELIFYSSGNFMSRKGIGEKSITMHVHGMIHGPQPGVVEKSIGAEKTDEVAIMVESYKWLLPTEKAESIKDKNYQYSWKSEKY
jgi:homogentisate 1,2-dioxygenase